MLLLAACGTPEPTQPPLRLDATIEFPPEDTIRISLPASTAWCRDGRSLLLESLDPEGNGVMLHVRYRDSLTSDSFPIVMPGDTSVAIGAVIAVRFFLHDTPRGYTLDSGSVHLRRTGSSISVKSTGVGIESAIRIRAHLDSREIPIGRDTVSCTTSP